MIQEGCKLSNNRYSIMEGQDQSPRENVSYIKQYPRNTAAFVYSGVCGLREGSRKVIFSQR